MGGDACKRLHGAAGPFHPNIDRCCRTQAEIDHYWSQLSQGGDATAQMCGWLKDRYGVSWQVVPDQMLELVGDPEKGPRVFAAMLKMKKLDLATLERAAA